MSLFSSMDIGMLRFTSVREAADAILDRDFDLGPEGCVIHTEL